MVARNLVFLARTHMNAKDIADLLVMAIGKIEFYWNFYTVTMLALLGWLISTDSPVTLLLKLLITIGYIIFVLMNVIGLISSYSIAETLQQDLLNAIRAEPNQLANTQKILSKRSFKSQRKLVPLIHIILGALVLGTVWLGL